jgi:hypothetical protein
VDLTASTPKSLDYDIRVRHRVNQHENCPRNPYLHGEWPTVRLRKAAWGAPGS